MVSLTATSENNSRNFINLPLFIREQDFIVKDLTTDSEKIQAYCLRHRIFCQESGWVPQRENGQEMDEYDHRAVFLGDMIEEGGYWLF
jgi:hypothetical protein